jgi:4-amino-4-deoxy-L-arabinose transferase-like glycosyltransferase
MISRRTEIIFVFTLLTISALLIPIKSVYLGDAASNNLANALSLFEKGEPLLYRRGPLYYLLIAIFFKVFGVSVEHAVWVTRIFIPLNIALVYVVTRSMINRRTAAIASILVLFSYPLNLEASKLTLDNIMPFFMLLSLWFSWLAVERQSIGLAITSGFALGLAWLVKEAAMFFLPMFCIPLLFRKHRNKWTLLLACLSVSIFITTLLPWFGYSLSKGNSLSILFGAASPHAAIERVSLEMSYSDYILKYFILGAPAGLYYYVQNYLRPNFAIWPFVILGLFYGLLRAYKKRSLGLSYLVGGIILFSPIAVYQGAFGERLGQCYIIFLLLYMILAFALDDLSRFLAERYHGLEGNYFTKGLIFVVTLLIIFELTNPLNGMRKSTLALWTFSKSRCTVFSNIIDHIPVAYMSEIATDIGLPNYYAQKLEKLAKRNQSRSGFMLGERFDEGIQETADWVLTNIPPGTPILLDGHLTESVPFYTRFRYPVQSFVTRDRYRAYNSDGQKFNYIEKGRLLGIISYHNFRSIDVERYRTIFLYFEKALLEKINNTRAEYVFAFKPDSNKKRYANFYNSYFERQEHLTKVFENRRALIFKIEALLEPLDKEDAFFYQNSSFADDMIWLKANFPNEYHRVADMLVFHGKSYEF